MATSVCSWSLRIRLEQSFELAPRRLRGRARLAMLSASAILAGAAASTKWTGLTALGLIGILWLFDTVWTDSRVRTARVLGEGLLLVALPATVYFGSFALHFALLPNDGVGVRVMSADFAATRRGNPSYRPEARISFARELAENHRAMLATNLGSQEQARICSGCLCLPVQGLHEADLIFRELVGLIEEEPQCAVIKIFVAQG